MTTTGIAFIYWPIHGLPTLSDAYYGLIISTCMQSLRW